MGGHAESETPLAFTRRLAIVEKIALMSAPGIKAKVENKGQYEQYLEELKPLREELGVALKEELYPEKS